MGIAANSNEAGQFPPGVAVVIGGSGGIGRAISIRLAQSGTNVVLTYRSNAEAGHETAAAVRETGRSADVHQLSVDDRDGLKTFMDRVIADHENVHTVVYAAGPTIPMRYISELQPDDMQRVLETDAGGFFNLVSASLPHLRSGTGGSLIAITTAGLERYPVRDILSVAPKAAVEAMIRGLAREEGRHGVRTNCVALGVIESGMFLRLKEEELDDEWKRAALHNIALRRFGTADEVAEAVAFLASERASYITGQTLMLDGGYSL